MPITRSGCFRPLDNLDIGKVEVLLARIVVGSQIESSFLNIDFFILKSSTTDSIIKSDVASCS